MPNKFYKGRFALAGMLLVGMLASCNGPIDSGSSIPSLPGVDSSELVSEDPIESSVDTNPVSEETVESSEVTRYALILQYDQALLSVTGADGNPLAAEYEEGATVSFRVSILNETYGNLSVNVNGTALEAVDGVYSFTMTRKTTVRLTVELITVSLTTDNSNVSLVFVGEDGADLESQTGSFVTGSSVRFRLSSRVTGYTEFHDLTVKLGEETLVPVDGIYSIASLTEDTVLNVTATEHVIGEDFACTNCGHDMKAYAFAAKDNCTVEYIEEKGWKVSAIDKNAGYEFVVNPSILSYYYSKGQTYAKFLFGNGVSFGTHEQDGVEGNPVNCSFNAIGYNADLTASTKYAEGFFSGMNLVGGDDDICGPAFNLEADKTDIRFYVNPNDSVGKAVGTSYIYGFTAIDPLGVDAYFQADPGESATYTEGSGWKVTGNHFKLSGNIVAHHLSEGKKTMRITFGPAFDGAIDNAETVRLIINAADANNQTKKLADQTVNSMTPSGRGGHYYMDFDLTDASTDWSKGLEFYSWGLGGQYVAYFTGIEFLDDEVSSEPAKNSYLICDNGETGYYTEGSGWVSTGAHFRINGSVINHYKAAGKKTMRVTFGAGQRLIINASVGGTGTQLFDDYVTALTADASGNYYMDLDLLDETYDWSWGIEVYSYTGNVVIPGIDFLDTEIDRSPSKESYFAFDSSADTVTYSEESGWTASLLSGNHFKLSGSVISYFKDLGKKTLRLTFGHNERYIINVNQNGSAVTIWNDYAVSMSINANGDAYMEFDLTDSTIDWTWGIEFFTWGTTGSNPYTVRITAMDFLDEAIDHSPSKESYFAFDSSADTVAYSEESGWTASLLSGNHFKLSGNVISYYMALGKKTLRIAFGHNERYVINVNQNGATAGVWDNYTASMSIGANGDAYMEFDLTDSSIEWSWGIEFFTYGVTGSNPYTIRLKGIDFLDEAIDNSPSKESYFAFDSSADTVAYSEESGWTASLLSGNHFKLSGSVISYFKDLGKSTMRITFGHNERYVINVNQNGGGVCLWDNYTSAMAADSSGNPYMDLDLTDSTIDWSWGIEFYTWGTTGSNPYTVRILAMDFLD